MGLDSGKGSSPSGWSLLPVCLAKTGWKKKGKWGTVKEKVGECSQGASVSGTAVLRSAQEYEPTGGQHEL
ncbi:hypothetical protein GW7_16825 [Heterocephalus glaber]|uniref:Uncharacterized protein n=1 Tax=Heterocephalus glaber TaxID=10181 RepID=G5BKY4_HETGA|nr:hypothetical protein GW7_16825 [Heterocephalus glaber]